MILNKSVVGYRMLTMRYKASQLIFILIFTSFQVSTYGVKTLFSRSSTVCLVGSQSAFLSSTRNQSYLKIVSFAKTYAQYSLQVFCPIKENKQLNTFFGRADNNL